MGETRFRVGLICALASAAYADQAVADEATPTVRALIDKSNARQVLLDSELPAGKEFTLELLGATANDQVVVTIEHRPDCTKSGGGKQRHEFVMIPITRDDATVMQARIPRLQIRKRYCVDVTIYGGLPSAVLETITSEVIAITAPELKNAGFNKASLMALLKPQLKSSLAPQLLSRGLTAASSTVDEVADAALNGFLTSSEVATLRAKRADLDAKSTHVNGTPAGVVPAQVGTGALRDAKQAALVAALNADAGKLLWPGSKYAFVVADKVVPADAVWDTGLDQADFRAAVAAQLAARLRDSSVPHKPLTLWTKELARTEGTRPKAMPVLKPVKPIDVWLETRGGKPDPGFVAIDAALARANLTVAEWQHVIAQLRSLATLLPAAGPPGVASARLAATNIADAMAEVVRARADHDEAAAALATAQTDHKAAVEAAETRLRTLLLAALKERRFELSAGREASGRGVTTSLENWVSINVGVAAAMPFTRPRDSQTDMNGDASAHGWLVPYFAVNVHAPQERTIPPGRLVDEVWQRLCLTGGILITDPDPIEGHAVGAVLFSRSALLSVGVRVTPYSRLAFGSLFYRIQNHTSGGDSSLGLAPFIGYSLDIDAVKLVKDGFTGL